MGYSRRHFCVAALASWAAAAVGKDAHARPAEPPIPALPLQLAVATLGDAPVVTDAWLEHQVSEAQRLLAPHGLDVGTVAHGVLPPELAALETAADRDALGAHLAARVINVFV